MSLNNKIEKSDLARDALYDKVNLIAEELDEKKQELLIAGENIKTINGESIVGSGNVEISGLNRNISNCITEIPQDIKLELNNGDLTLKAGSKVWIPYGTSDIYNIGDVDSFGNTVVDKSFSNGKFFYAITVTVDTATRADAINAYTVVYNTVEKRMDYWGWDGTTSFDGYNTTDGMHYNISENNIRIRVNGGIYGDNFSLPICVVSKNTTSTTGFTSIDQVFNSFGYIGSTIFALPGVKGLIPNGRNEDGSLRNIELVNNEVKTRYLESNQTYTNAIFALATTGIGVYYYTYDEKGNYLLSGNSKLSDRFSCGLMSSTNGIITSFNLKTTFKALDSNDLDILAGNIVTTTGISKSENGYVKLGNGMIIQWGVSSMTTGGSTTITFPFAFSAENTYTISTGYFSPGSSRDNPIVITARTATNFTVVNKAGSGTLYCYFHAIGY